MISDAAHAGGVFRVFYRLGLAKRHGLGYIDGDFRGSRLKTPIP